MPGVSPGLTEWVLGGTAWCACFLALLIWVWLPGIDMATELMLGMSCLFVCCQSRIWKELLCMLTFQLLISSILSPGGDSLLKVHSHTLLVLHPLQDSHEQMHCSTPLCMGQPCTWAPQSFISFALSLGREAPNVHAAVPHYFYTFSAWGSPACLPQCFAPPSLQEGSLTWEHSSTPLSAYFLWTK